MIRTITAMCAVAALAACSNSGLGQLPTEPTDSVVVPTPPGPTEDCEFAGSWEVFQVDCGSFDVTGNWTTDYNTTIMFMAHNPDGGCDINFSWAQDGVCQEDETWFLDPTTTEASENLEISYLGITACSPDGCTFGGNDAACTVGDRAGTATISVDGSTGDLIIGNLIPHGNDACTLTLTTYWRQI